MVDRGTTNSLKYNAFRGLNKRDDEVELVLGETPEAQNFELSRRTGLKKKTGFTQIFDELRPWNDIYVAENYTNKLNENSYLAVSYPQLLNISTDTGAVNVLTSSLNNTGDPYIFALDNGESYLVDGANPPLLIKTASSPSLVQASWPPNYVAANNDQGNVGKGNEGQAANPNPTDIGFPSFGEYHLGRVWLAGDSLNPHRLYCSKIGDVTDYSDNTILNWDIAFFVDVPSKSPVTALKTINDEYLVIYCEREIFLLTGAFPAGTDYPEPYFKIKPLNNSVGCLHHRLLASYGNNDHFFVSGEGKVFQLSLTDNFQKVRPKGLTDIIYPLFQSLNNETLKRGRLINHQRQGELWFFFPSENHRRYSDQVLVYNYEDTTGEPQWSYHKGFGSNFTLRSALIDRGTSNLILVTPTKFLDANRGLSYDGEPIETVYQLSTLDFGAVDLEKEIVEIIIYAKSLTGATVLLEHLWDNKKSAITPVRIEAQSSAEYGSAEYGVSEWSSGAGLPFQRIGVRLLNRRGNKLKMRIRHTSSSESFFIHSIIFRCKFSGTRP